MIKFLVIPLYGLLEALLGPRTLIDVTPLYKERHSKLEAVTSEQTKLIISCIEHHFHVRYLRSKYKRHYSMYHVSATVEGKASEAFTRAADFEVHVPATYPHVLNPQYSEQAAIDHYLDQLKARLPVTAHVYREV
jgi:hypothetical protein